jgi:nogalonic acid methyl ester cyclase/aklanonic acid methyl ester cyclase
MSPAVTAVRRMLTAMQTGDVSDAADYIHPDFLNAEALDRSDARGPEGWAQSVGWFRATFGDVRVHVNDVTEMGDQVFASVIIGGRQVGELADLPATGYPVHLEQLHVMRLIDGKVVEHRDWRDDVTTLRQLGLPPALLGWQRTA